MFLPILGQLVKDDTAYRVITPVNSEDLRDVVRERWCHQLRISDGQGGKPEFTARCEYDGRQIVVVGQIETF